MAVSVGLSPIPVLQFFDNTGKPAVGGSLLTQVGGVNYPTYSDVNGTVALPNPIPLNSRGEASTSAGSSTTVFLQQGVSYTFTLSDSNGNQLWSIGNIASNDLSIPYASTSGTNAIVATFAPAITSLFDGLTVEIKLANTTTASPTFNPNGLGALNVYLSDGVTQWPAGSGLQNVTYTLVYNSSLNSSAGGWEVMNPSRITGSFTGTGTGFSGSVTATVTYRTTADFTQCSFIFGTFTGTSNATSFTITGMPSFLTPAQTQAFYITPADNATNTTGSIWWTASSATITLGKSAVIGTGTTAWTASGTKSFQASITASQVFNVVLN